MTLRRLGSDRVALLFVIVAASPLTSACSGDSNVDFTPVGGSSFGAAASGGNGSAGDVASGGTNASAGTSASAGDAAMGGTGANGGNGTSGDAGNNSGGGMAGTAGADVGGNAGMTSGGMSGMSSGGDAGSGGMGGSAQAGNAGSGGNSGSGGAAGSAQGGNAGNGGTGGNAQGGSAGSGGSAGNGGNAGMGGSGMCSPTAEICDGIDNNCDNQIDPKGTCPDGCTGAIFGGHRYIFCGSVSNGSGDLTVCNNANMSTLTIESAEENAFILSKINGDTWLGGSDYADEGVWRWIPTNDTFWNKGDINGKYENWQSQHPSLKALNIEDCMIIQTGGGAGKWTDIGCDSGGKRAACEVALP